MEVHELNKPHMNLKLLGEYVSRERTTDTISSVAILGKRIFRQYASEFILPDDTRVAIRRHELIQPADGTEEVTLTLSVGVSAGTYHLENFLATVEKQGSDSGAVTSMSGTSSDEVYTEASLDTDAEQGGKNTRDRGHFKDQIATKGTKSRKDRHSAYNKYTHPPNGLRIEDYMYDDPWAAAILTADSSANSDLLRQLEIGCRLEPELYRMERIQRRSNRKTTVDVHREPVVRSIELSRAQSEADSIATEYTNLDDDDEQHDVDEKAGADS